MVPASVVEFVFAALDGARCPDGSRMAAGRVGDATVLATSRGVFRVVVVPADPEHEAKRARACIRPKPRPNPGPERLTHGRHCPCSSCCRQDWSEPQLVSCGMHGYGCPPVYDPYERPS